MRWASSGSGSGRLRGCGVRWRVNGAAAMRHDGSNGRVAWRWWANGEATTAAQAERTWRRRLKERVEQHDSGVVCKMGGRMK
jgi:hypothetical protein